MDWNEFLHEAIAGKDADLVRQALAEGADPNRPDASDDSSAGTTELYWAVFGGQAEIVRLLLGAGAKVAKARERKRGEGPAIYEAMERAARRFQR